MGAETGLPLPPADEKAGNEALGSSLAFTLVPDNWAPFQEQVGPDTVIGRGQGQSPREWEGVNCSSPPPGGSLLERELYVYRCPGEAPVMKRARFSCFPLILCGGEGRWAILRHVLRFPSWRVAELGPETRAVRLWRLGPWCPGSGGMECGEGSGSGDSGRVSHCALQTDRLGNRTGFGSWVPLTLGFPWGSICQDIVLS